MTEEDCTCVNKHTRYKQSEIKIELQDMIIVFTDGVTELRDRAK